MYNLNLCLRVDDEDESNTIMGYCDTKAIFLYNNIYKSIEILLYDCNNEVRSNMIINGSLQKRKAIISNLRMVDENKIIMGKCDNNVLFNYNNNYKTIMSKYYNDRCAVTKRPVTLYDCREEAYDDQIKIIITTRTTTTTTATSKSNFTSNNFNNKLYSKGECYSYYGYCGIGCNYCSIGYQPDYGRCNNGSLFNMAIVTSRMFIEDQNVKVNLDYAMALTINVVNNIVDVIL
ncbi:hypothetical protein U3516DRAFT_841720 [Neocallimastix sp. 'constans']